MKFLKGLFLITISTFGFNYHLKPYTISKDIYCFFGLLDEPNKINGGNVVNSCYVTTDKGYVVIDSGPTYSYAQQAFRIMQQKNLMPIRYVINTSTDEVHILGSEFYKERDAKIIGAKGLYEKNGFIKLSTIITEDAFINTRVISPDIKIDDSMTINLGKTDINIKKAIEKEDGYLLVLIPSKNLIFVGDMVYQNSIPILSKERGLLDWIRLLQEIKDGSWNRIIPAHGIKTKQSSIENTINYLTSLKNLLIKIIQTGTKNIEIESFQKTKFYKKWHKKNVQIGLDELKKSVIIDKKNNDFIK